MKREEFLKEVDGVKDVVEGVFSGKGKDNVNKEEDTEILDEFLNNLDSDTQKDIDDELDLLDEDLPEEKEQEEEYDLLDDEDLPEEKAEDDELDLLDEDLPEEKETVETKENVEIKEDVSAPITEPKPKPKPKGKPKKKNKQPVQDKLPFEERTYSVEKIKAFKNGDTNSKGDEVWTFGELIDNMDWNRITDLKGSDKQKIKDTAEDILTEVLKVRPLFWSSGNSDKASIKQIVYKHFNDKKLAGKINGNIGNNLELAGYIEKVPSTAQLVWLV